MNTEARYNFPKCLHNVRGKLFDVNLVLNAIQAFIKLLHNFLHLYDEIIAQTPLDSCFYHKNYNRIYNLIDEYQHIEGILLFNIEEGFLSENQTIYYATYCNRYYVRILLELYHIDTELKLSCYVLGRDNVDKFDDQLQSYRELHERIL